MADTWLTIEQAAVTLNLSVRTVNRHISSGKLKSRLHEGRREVLVSASGSRAEGQREPEGPVGKPVSAKPTDTAQPELSSPLQPDFVTDAREGAQEQELPPFSPSDHSYPTPDDSDRQSRVGESEALLVLAESARDRAELAVRAYQTLARSAEEQITRSQRSARFAWSVVGLTVVAVVIAVGWTTRRLTTVEINYDNLQQQMSQAALTADKAGQDAEALRRDVYEANNRAARAEGRAAAVAESVVTRPTTLPATRPSIVDRLTLMMEGQE